MEFWGEEVKPGAKVSCRADEGYVIHLSQAALGETKKGSENVVVSIQVDDKKLVLGTLSVDKHPQIMCDLIFEDDFEISHSSKTASVFLCGYKSPIPIFEPDSGDDEISSDEELETEDIPIKNDEIKKSGADVPVKNVKNVKQDDDEETSSGDDGFTDDSDDSEMSEDSDEETSSGADLTGDSEDETDDSEEQTPTPKKPEVVGKKRATEAVASSGKKAKVEPSGKKTGDKKGVHVSTPHPAKQASKTPAEKSGKTPATDKKSKDKSPKSGSHACKSCSKTFGSDKALESHKKAKHEA
ncbi:histone deacetylase HDT2 isoform X1 [Setaria italica]|uniref:histone deacetylase HDT2 isoform X1 n=1 Tax=Setaria italica TaxID=4555 RepID=UPI000BE603B0|nr:histone deacetylase HDT2 isoform X1 [Setaria italica]